MATRTEHYPNNITLAELQTTCNTDERNIRGQLQSLDAVEDTNGDKVTEAVFDRSKRTNLGELTIKKKPGSEPSGKEKAFDGTAFILTVDHDVVVFRTKVEEEEEE